MITLRNSKHENIQVFYLVFFTIHLKMVNLTIWKLDLDKSDLLKYPIYIFTLCNFYKGVNVTKHIIFRPLVLLFSLAFPHSSLLINHRLHFSTLKKVISGVHCILPYFSQSISNNIIAYTHTYIYIFPHIYIILAIVGF